MLLRHRHIFLGWTVLLFIFHLTGLSADEEPFKDGLISFKYGVVGKTKTSPENLFEVNDNSVLHSGDFIKINFKMESKANFYGIFKFSNGEYYLFYSFVNLNEKNYPKTVMTSLDWFEFDDHTGTETIYFIASKEPLSKLMDLFVKYQDSKKKLKEKWVRAISQEINSLAQKKEKESVLLTRRLQKPESIGATIRGVKNGDDIENKLFQHCSGEDIAFVTMTIIHK